MEDAKFEREAVRWLVRLAEGRRLSVRLAAALAALRAEPERALRVLADLSR